MSIWGEADANEFPDDPFRVDPNWYPAISTECWENVLDEDEGTSQICVKWKINLPGSQFNGLPITDRKFFHKPPKDCVDAAAWTKSLDGEQRRANGFLKMMLRNAFDLTPDELNRFTPTMGLNKEAMIEVTNNPDKTNDQIIYNNVRGVVSKRLYAERQNKNGAPPQTPDDPWGTESVSTGASMLDEM